ncbi:MAG: ABC transporter permease [Brevundimonas sp.]|uniref:ABC transporter permease n=1 Tax=Brevundimonas sp. TaxID=1871086 RepID=UPI00256B8AEB|nr:ABC transporter permease [Brevundimonas sp.]MDK2746714.1 ABC transporter permease [Brevundimonas sp.]
MIGALFMREIMTRYGRDGIGFLWLIGEPLLFCMGVIGMWTIIKPEYEHGVRIAPFVMTGYMCLILFRHIVSHNISALQANVGLMFHRSVKPPHIFFSRTLLEWGGATVAFIIVYTILYVLGTVKLPSNVLVLYGGWILLGLLSFGFSLIFSALSLMFEVMERVVPVFMYLMIPFSGAFIMVDWLPSGVQKYYLLIPMPHTVEMIRSSVFGEFVPTHFDPMYPAYWSIATIALGFLLLFIGRRKLDIE